MQKIDRLLVEKYRPKTVDEYIFQNEEVEYKVRKWIKKGSIPNVMLSGTQGTGKSTLAKILINDLGVDSADVRVVNASINGIGYVRDVLEPWMKKASFGKFKIILFEEADAMSKANQKALRDITEANSDDVRWIFTCNYPKNLIGPLHSRFQHLALNSMNYDMVVNMVIDIIEKEGIKFDGDPEEILLGHVDAHQPDVRKILNSIDEHCDENMVLHRLTNDEKGLDEAMWKELWESGNVTLEAALKLTHMIDQSNFDWFYEVIYTNSHNLPDQAAGVVLCSQYLDRAQVSANQQLHLDAFLYNVWCVDTE